MYLCSCIWSNRHTDRENLLCKCVKRENSRILSITQYMFLCLERSIDCYALVRFSHMTQRKENKYNKNFIYLCSLGSFYFTPCNFRCAFTVYIEQIVCYYKIKKTISQTHRVNKLLFSSELHTNITNYHPNGMP